MIHYPTVASVVDGSIQIMCGVICFLYGFKFWPVLVKDHVKKEKIEKKLSFFRWSSFPMILFGLATIFGVFKIG